MTPARLVQKSQLVPLLKSNLREPSSLQVWPYRKQSPRIQWEVALWRLATLIPRAMVRRQQELSGSLRLQTSSLLQCLARTQGLFLLTIWYKQERIAIAHSFPLGWRLPLRI